MDQLPAWTALVLSVLNMIMLIRHRSTARRRRNAVGPADEIRAALTAARDYFVGIAFHPSRRNDLLAEHSVGSDLATRLTDLQARSDDSDLRMLMMLTVAQWAVCLASQLPPATPNPERTEQERKQLEEIRQRPIRDVALQGVGYAEAALARLTKLEADLPAP